jgi:hypothetical protein
VSIKVCPNRVVRICDAALLMLDEMADDIEAFCLPLEADCAARQAKADEEYKAERAKEKAEWEEYQRASKVWENQSTWVRGERQSAPASHYIGSWLFRPYPVHNFSPRERIQALRKRIECMRSLGRMAVHYFDVDEANAMELDQWEHGKHAEQVRAWIAPKVEA